ncbi:MAG: hypothetical protein EA351_08760 [Gemmatimonadales bacterium]|nr:MAG: hypothetical protein EA351_08760 [Gemmatimonadales bacterium]
MPAALNSLEQQILDYMVRYLRANTYQPSIREIGEEFGIRSTKTVSEHLRALDEKGYLKRDPSRSRGIRILGVDLSPQTVSVPCYPGIPDNSEGFISDGVEAYLAVDRRLGGAKGCYFIRARGDTFAGLGVEPESLLLVEPSSGSRPGDGDLAVGRVNGAAELLRIHAADEGFEVATASGDPDRLRVESLDELELSGRVTALYRRFDGAPVTPAPTAH